MLGKKQLENNIIDTLSLARDKFPGSSVSLDSLCKRYRIDNSKRTYHTALIDCELLAKVYINLIGQKEPTLNFNQEDLINENINTSKVSYYKKIIEPTNVEIELHNEYLNSNLKKNNFN